MLAIVHHQLDVPDDTDLAALRDQATALYADAAGVTVVSANAAQASRSYTVHGVDTATSEPFTETVQAVSADEAGQQVSTETRVVAAVSEGLA